MLPAGDSTFMVRDTSEAKSDIVAYKELPAAAPAEWTLRLSDVFATNDAAISLSQAAALLLWEDE